MAKIVTYPKVHECLVLQTYKHCWLVLTEGVCNGSIDWEKLLSAISEITSSDGFRNSDAIIPLSNTSNRVQLTEKQIRQLDLVLPDGYKSYELINMSDDGLWGGSGDSLFCFYPWTRSTGKDEAIGNFRTGPRVKALYVPALSWQKRLSFQSSGTRICC